VIKKRTPINTSRKGIIALNVSSNLVSAILDATKSEAPIGGVFKAIVRFKTIEWTHKRKNSHYISMIR